MLFYRFHLCSPHPRLSPWLFVTSTCAFEMFTALVLGAALVGVSSASFPPVPTGLTIVNSTKFPGASISYKEVCQLSPLLPLSLTDHSNRHPYVRPRKTSRASVATCTFHPMLSKAVHTAVTHISGSSRPARTLRMLLFPSGFRVAPVYHPSPLQWEKTDHAISFPTPRALNSITGRGTIESTCYTLISPSRLVSRTTPW